MMFGKIFYNLINEDLMGLSEPSNPHHRVAIRGLDRKSQSQIPDIHKSSGHGTERKILMIRDNGGVQPCNNIDLQYIISKYNIGDLNKPKQLGKTGVILTKNQNGAYIITR